MKKSRDYYIRDYIPVFIGIAIFCVLGVTLFFVIKYQNPNKPLEVQEEPISAKFKEKKVDISSSTCPKVDLADLKEEADKVELSYEYYDKETGEEAEYDSIFEMESTEYTLKIPLIYITNLTDNIYVILESNQYNDSYKKITTKDINEDGFAVYEGVYSEKALIYTVRVYIDVDNCHDVMIRKFTMQVPVYNKYVNQARCSYYPDFKYCAEYLSEDLPSYNTFIYEFNKYIKDVERGKVTTRSTTNVMQAFVDIDPSIREEAIKELEEQKAKEQENKKIVNIIKNNKMYYFIGGAVVILVLTIIIFIVVRKRRNRK